MSEYQNVFGYMVESYKSLKGLTQTDIAFKLCMSLRHYQRHLKGITKPTNETLRLCIEQKILTCDQADIVDIDKIGCFKKSGFIYKKPR